MIVRGQHQPFGILSVHTTKRRMLGPDELAFLRAVADVVAAAVYRFNPSEKRQREPHMQASRATLR